MLKISLGGAITIGAVSNHNLVKASERSRKIPYIRKGDEVILSKEVPEQWYFRYREALRLTRKAKKLHLDNEAITSIGLGKLKHSNKQLEEFQVRITRKPEVNVKIPNYIENIPVKEIQQESEPKLMSCENIDNYDDLPGGVVVEGAKQEGTTCLMVKDSNDNDRMLSARHLFEECSNSIINDGTVNQHCNKYGKATSPAHRREDWALINPTESGKGLKPGINEEGWIYDVSGHYTKAALADMCCEDDSDCCNDGDCSVIRSMGIMTGMTQGVIIELCVTPNQCVHMGGEGIKIDADHSEAPGGDSAVAQGDSGGPMYGIEAFGSTQYAAIAGIIQMSSGDQLSSITCNLCTGENEGAHFDQVQGIAFYHLRGQGINVV